jgi:copper chaperone CopZ
MRTFILTFFILMTISGATYADTIHAGVNGMVCAFCATGVEKSFQAQPAVETVKVDLEAKAVTITTKEGQDLDDGTVKKIITNAGYTVTEIKREKNNAVKK